MTKEEIEKQINSNKFSKTIDESMLEDIIDYLKEAGYINDEDYIDRAINEFIALKSLSLKEVKYKLLAKGVNKNLIEDYMYKHSDKLNEYEAKSATKIAIKKSTSMDENGIKQFLFKKGYRQEIVELALDEINLENN